MTTQEVANRLVELCRAGDFETCYRELYSPEIESIEPDGAALPYAKGFEAIQAKGEKWQAGIVEMHGAEIGDPICAADHFSCTWTVDATFKEMGRMKMEEICLYKVKDGKVVKEQFFYTIPSQA
ncbi:MAG: ester cyclase [Saprospiraceae bacterium]|nr:ester cyclase [Saprospiraceae bacterium]